MLYTTIAKGIQRKNKLTTNDRVLHFKVVYIINYFEREGAMNQVSDKQVKKLFDDIATIKSAINDNLPVIRQLLQPRHFTTVSYISGIGIIAVSMAYYFLLKQYEAYPAIPQGIRTLLLVVIGVLVLTVWILKGVLWVKSVRRINADFTFRQMLKNLYSGQILHVWVPTICLFVVFILYFVKTGRPDLIVPLLCYGTGFMYNMIGGMTGFRQFLVTGYWVILTGTLSFLFPQVCGLLWLSVSLGAGLILFAVVSKKLPSPGKA